MGKIFDQGIIIGIGLMCLLGCQEAEVEQPATPEPSIVQQMDEAVYPGVIQIKFKQDADADSIEAYLKRRGRTRMGVAQLDAVGEKYNIKNIERIFRYSPEFEEVHRRFGLHRWYRLELDESRNTRSAVIDYAALPEIEIAEPVYRKVYYGGGKITPVEIAQVAAAASSHAPFNDPLLCKQWHYDVTDSVKIALQSANIHLFRAWKVNTGNPNVIVAVNDEGIDVTHPDLAANLWVNLRETKNGQDDDGNGYSDDIHGYNFYDNSGEIVAMDHGTHVAGTIGAVNNNGIGVSGIAGGNGSGNGVRIMCCQIWQKQAAEIGRYAAEALVYNADMGAVISQNSWGYGTSNAMEKAVAEAIDYFVQHAGYDKDGNQVGPIKGGVVIFSSGNLSNNSELYYPAAYSPCIAVSATDHRNKRPSYANIGRYVDISAPGGSSELGVLSTISGGKYGYMNGTSMSCPHVSGIAALIASQYGGMGFTKEDLETRLLESKQSLRPYEPKLWVDMGQGIADASMALEANDSTCPEPVKDLQVVLDENKDFQLSWTVTADAKDGTASRYYLYYSEKELNASNYRNANSVIIDLTAPTVGKQIGYTLPDLDEGQDYWFAVVGEDFWGNVSALSNIVTYTAIADDAVKAGPNPVKKELTITWGKNYQKKLSVAFYDMSGRLVLSRSLDGAAGKAIVNLSALAPGMYTMRLEADGGSKVVKIVKR